MLSTEQLELARTLRTAGLKKSYAHMIAGGQRSPSLALAIQIHSEVGVKLGPLVNLSDEEIAILAKTLDGVAA